MWLLIKAKTRDLLSRVDKELVMPDRGRSETAIFITDIAFSFPMPKWEAFDYTPCQACSPGGRALMPAPNILEVKLCEGTGFDLPTLVFRHTWHSSWHIITFY